MWCTTLPCPKAMLSVRSGSPIRLPKAVGFFTPQSVMPSRLTLAVGFAKLGYSYKASQHLSEGNMPKTVLITGAGSGFGRGAAVQLAQRGHKVIAGVLDDQQARELAKAEPKLTVAKLDITAAKDIAKVGEWNLDVFIANAAIGQTGPLSLIPLERLRTVFEVNVFGTFAITQRVALAMRKK